MTVKNLSIVGAAAVLGWLAVACTGDAGGAAADSSVLDSDAVSSDAMNSDAVNSGAVNSDATPEDAGPQDDGADTGDPGSGQPNDDDADGSLGADTSTGDVDAGPAPLLSSLQPTLSAPVPLPLPDGVESCGLFLEERCDADTDTDINTRYRCELFDSGTASFVEDPDPLLRRAYLYDRWYDLYNSPDGQTVKRVLGAFTPGDTPEEEWGAFEHFDHYRGGGDAAIWTGVALNADIFRWQATGSAADWERVERKVRQVVRLFDVTGVPGYLARYHLLRLPVGAPRTDAIITHYGDETTLSHMYNPIEDPEGVDGLPVEYLEGVAGEDGVKVEGVPMWSGAVSIDQYTGPFVALPMVLPFLEDEELVARITMHMTCYLKRLRRLEIIGLQESPEVLAGLSKLFGDGTLQLDDGDIDLTQLDRIVGYYHEGLNAKNVDTFDRSCPDTMALEPTRLLDARDDDFFLDMLELGLDLDAKKQFREGQADHFYAVNVRGGDASHMMHMVALAWWLTGEEHYREFFHEELIGNLDAVAVALTVQAFRTPRWCYKYYADHISYGTHWQFITMLPEGPLRDDMIRVMHEEHWLKGLQPLNNAKFDVLYASTVPAALAGDWRDHAILEAAELLAEFGGNGGTLEAPRRDYVLDRADVVAALPDHITTVCPTSLERKQCEEPGDVLGIPLDEKIISHTCDDRAAECLMDDGLCTDAVASEGLPMALRSHGGFMWQLDPLRMGSYLADPGREQSHGRDLAEPYWMARYYGYIEEGAGTLLAWQPLGACDQ